MVLQGRGTIYQHVKGKMYVYIPAGVRDDSQFPFKPGEKVSFRPTNNPEKKDSKLAVNIHLEED